MQYEYCGGPINGKPKVLEFANFQRFFAALAARTITERSMQEEYTVNRGTIQRHAKRGEENNLIPLETNYFETVGELLN